MKHDQRAEVRVDRRNVFTFWVSIRDMHTLDEIRGKEVKLLAENGGKSLADQITDGLLGSVVTVDRDIKL